MSGTETPGGHLARLRATYGGKWRIERTGKNFMAEERSTKRGVYGTTVGDLEGKLVAQRQWGQGAGGGLRGR
jgi:hypothetical protein